MGTSVGSLSGAGVTVVLITMFVIVLVIAHRALREMPLFGDGGSWIVAFCTAALSVLGFLRFLGPQEHGARTDRTTTAPDGMIDFILLPYAALAIAILLMLLLLAWSKARPDRSDKCREPRPTKPMREAEALMKQRRVTPQTSLRTRLEK
jgi:hypothetical protein